MTIRDLVNPNVFTIFDTFNAYDSITYRDIHAKCILKGLESTTLLHHLQDDGYIEESTNSLDTLRSYRLTEKGYKVTNMLGDHDILFSNNNLYYNYLTGALLENYPA